MRTFRCPITSEGFKLATDNEEERVSASADFNIVENRSSRTCRSKSRIALSESSGTFIGVTQDNEMNSLPFSADINASYSSL
jgi:hypothetical protein